MSSFNNLNTIANSIGYEVRKLGSLYLVARPKCRTGRMVEDLQGVAECLASMIRGIHNKLAEKQEEGGSVYENFVKNYQEKLARKRKAFSHKEIQHPWFGKCVEQTKLDQYSDTELTIFWNNARLTSNCIGHGKAERNEINVRNYARELHLRGIDNPEVFPEDGEFVKYNGRGSA